MACLGSCSWNGRGRGRSPDDRSSLGQSARTVPMAGLSGSTQAEQSAEVPSPPQPAPAPTPKIAQPPKRSQKLRTPPEQRVEQIRHVTQAVQAVTPTTHQEIRKAEQVVHPERTPIEAVPSQPAITREMQSLNKTAETTFGRLRGLPPHQLQNPLQASPSRVQRKRVPL